MTALIRFALLADFPEESWPSMDLCADMLADYLPIADSGFRVERLCPPFHRGFGFLPVVGRRRVALNADRFLNRYFSYPCFLHSRRRAFDLFHIADHSYAHLTLELPADRTGVYCHDLDAFRCLLEPARERRPLWFRALSRRILRGVQRASVVFYSTESVGQALRRWEIVGPQVLVSAPYGIAPEFTTVDSVAALPTSLADLTDQPFLLHVGSSIPRKRIDVLLDVFARLHAQQHELRLVQVGGQWTEAQKAQIDRLDIGKFVHQIRGIDRLQLADLYRRAAVILQPSEAEGFGLPVVEALACGAVVVASDIPVLRVVGGPAVLYCPVADLSAWVETVSRVLASPELAPDRPTRLAWAARFSWAAQARTIASAYRRLLEKAPSVSSS